MNKTVDEYITSQKPIQKEILIKLRELIKKTLPGISEEMKGGVPCYGINKENPYGISYIVGLKNHVNISFSLKKLKPKQASMLTGNGKTMKVLELNNINEINEKLIIELLKSTK